MTENQWTEFVKIREDFKQHVKIWNDALKTESIVALQKELADADGVPEYPLEMRLCITQLLTALRWKVM